MDGNEKIGENEMISEEEVSSEMKRIEELLETQGELNKKILRSSRLHNVLLAIIAAVFVVMGVVFYGAIQALTRGIPGLVTSAQALITNTDHAVADVTGKVDELDIDALNDSIQGISSINYKGLNTSIGGLASAVESFQEFVDTLSHPANAIGSLFGGGRSSSRN